MKEKFLALAALVLGMVSCQTDVVDGVKVDANGEAPVTIQVSLPEGTRADSALGAIDNQIDLSKYDIRFILAVYDESGELAKGRMEQIGDEDTASFSFRLVPGRKYHFVAWADFVTEGTDADLHYNTADFPVVTLMGNQNLNDESRDAYTQVVTVDNFSGAASIPQMVLKRPFAKLRVVTTDMNQLYSPLNGAIVEYTTKVYTSFNALSSVVSGEPEFVGAKSISYGEDYANNVYGAPVNGEMTLFADYLFGGESDRVMFKVNVTDNTTFDIPTIEFNTNIPVQRNHLTTLYGPVLTDANNVTITIDDNFEQPDYNVDIWDGESKTEPTFETDATTGETVAVIDSASDLAWLADFVNNPSTRAANAINFVLAADIDLDNQPWTPIGTEANNFTGVFDGNGHSIKNLNIVVDEAKEGKAYMGLLGYANNATVKNLTLENVNINVACLDIDHSQGHIGAVAGSLEGTSTIEDVTVKGDVTVYTTQTANGASRVAVIAGGNAYGDVTMKNVHVIANEGSSLVANNNVGALAGQLQGKMMFENCSSNINVTANKFFAGGLVGIAAGDSYIKNCHTTGDVAVVAGRENRHNDEYRVGGIAGGWADGKTKVFTLEGCTYTGTISGKNSDGSVAEPLDYAGYVGRGYTLTNCAGSKVIVNGVAYIQKYDDVYGVYENEGGYEYIADGLCHKDKEYIVLSANGLVALAEQGLKAGDKVMLGANIDLAGVEFNGLDTFHPENNNTFDGQGFTVSNWTNNSGASDMGFIRNWVGTVKDVKFENCHLKTSGRSAIAAAKVYGNIENVTINNCSIEDSYWACGLVAGLYNAGNISGCTVTNSSVKSNGGTGAIVGVINETAGTRKVENCKVEGCTVNNTGAYGAVYSGALVCGMINISNSTVDFTGCSYNNNTKVGKYVGDLFYAADEDITVVVTGATVVRTAAELTEALSKNENVVLAADIDCGTTQLAISGANQVVNLNGHTLKTQMSYGGMAIKNGASIKNGTIEHTSTVAAIKAFNVGSIENVTIKTTCTTADKIITAIAVQQGGYVGAIKNVNIEGVSQGIEVGYQATVDSIENTVVNERTNGTANGIGLVINGGKVVLAKNSTFKGDAYGVTMHLKGVFAVGLELESCKVEGETASIYAWDEKGISNTSGTLNLTYDATTTLVGPFVWDFEEECQGVVTLNRPE